MQLKGNFNDFTAGVRAGGILGGAMKAITSPMHVPVARLFGEEPPADGRDVCRSPQAWRPLDK